MAKQTGMFDIFWFGEAGPTWVESASSFESAKTRIEQLPYRDSGAYGVVDFRTRNRIFFDARRTSPFDAKPIKSRAVGVQSTGAQTSK